jgi:hypothetical protein
MTTATPEPFTHYVKARGFRNDTMRVKNLETAEGFALAQLRLAGYEGRYDQWAGVYDAAGNLLLEFGDTKESPYFDGDSQ